MSQSLIAPVSSRSNVREALARLTPSDRSNAPRSNQPETRNSKPAPPTTPNILIKRVDSRKVINWPEFMWREMREGGYLQRYLEREKHTATRRVRQAARHMHGFKQNNKSDFRLLSCVPMREWLRWRKVDPNFWDDDKNLKSLKRDNPDLPIFV